MAKLTAPVMLCILDGFGMGDIGDQTNAVVQAHPTNFNHLWNTYPHTSLEASGLSVGLPIGQMGNSEVGHLNLGSGRIVYQDLTRITKDVEDGEFYKRPVIQKLYQHAKQHRLHLIALISDGNVHCSLDHVKAVILGAKTEGIKEVYVHALLDGRDVAPKSAMEYIDDLEHYMSTIGVGSIATVAGRFYAMDRDNRWERVELAYRAMVEGDGPVANSVKEAIDYSYFRDVVDEFIVPTILNPKGMIQDGDAVMFCNFRPDRGRELTKALVFDDFDGFKRDKLDIYMATMTKYEDNLPVDIVYEKDVLPKTLGEVLSAGGYRQLRIAETEKYAHVTYFFNGGKEVPFDGEDRILVNSPKVTTYDLQPEMSAYEVTDKVVEAIEAEKYDMIILNFANPDMVGHTGVFEAAVKAIKAVDTCLGRISEAILKKHGHLLVTADHGNSEVMVNHETNEPHTAHTTNLVPLILVSDTHKQDTLIPGKLCDIAPTMLALGGIEKPEEMTGHKLF